jgi:hypothetical protein
MTVWRESSFRKDVARLIDRARAEIGLPATNAPYLMRLWGGEGLIIEAKLLRQAETLKRRLEGTSLNSA